MRELKIPRGLIVFLGVMLILTMIAFAFRAISERVSTGSAPSGTHLFSALFPFGNPSIPPQTASTSDTTANLEGAKASGGVPALRHVSQLPVSGGWFVPGKTATSAPLIRYMDRQSGHVEEVPADSFTETRLSNTTLPGMEELYAIASSTVLLRTLNDAKNVLNYVGTIHASSSEETLDIAPTRTFDSVTVTPSGALFTVAKTSSGSVAEISSKGGGRVATVFASPISSWVPLAGGTRLFVQSAPSAFAPGYLYEIKNAGAGATLSKVAQGRSGFVALPSPSGRYIATSQNLDTGFAFFVLDTKSGTWWSAPIHGSAYSCAWIENAEPLIFCAVPKDPPHGNYPDDWLMGNISFSDDAWILNPPLNTAYYIGSLYDSSGTIDAEHVAVDQTGSYALFTNKKDLSLWSLYIRDAVIRAAGE